MFDKRKAKQGLALVAVVLTALACCDTTSGEPLAVPTQTPYQTYTPYPTYTPLPQPTDTPRPARTPRPSVTPRPTQTPERSEVYVVKIVDGDTITVQLAGQTYTLRYIGIDTPETTAQGPEWMGTEATEANRQLVGGRTVYLEKDVSEIDRYGRLLRYVFLTDGTFVNEELVRQGYAQVSTYPPDVRYEQLFLEAQAEARNAGRGLWGPTPAPTRTPLPPTATPMPPTQPPPAPTQLPPPPPPPTEPPPPPQPEPVCSCAGNIYNCANFGTHWAAQQCYEYCMSLGYGDIHRLDGDNDGSACESLP